MENILYSVFEGDIIVAIQGFMSEFMVKLAALITEFGDETILVAIVGLLYWCLNKNLGKQLVLRLGLVNVVGPCIKSSVKRLRPYMADSRISCLKPSSSEGDIYDITVQEYSFPSGHAANSAAVYGTLAARTKRQWLRAALIVLCILVGISRFALGVHYPSDVLCGWLAGGLCVLLYSVLEKHIGRYKTFILIDILGLAGFFIAKTNDFYTGYGLVLGSTLAIMFEEKYVNFEETRKLLPCILRVGVGMVLFLCLNEAMKLPFTDEFLSSGTTAAFIVRSLRYTVLLFLMLGVYPLSFRLWKK